MLPLDKKSLFVADLVIIEDSLQKRKKFLIHKLANRFILSTILTLLITLKVAQLRLEKIKITFEQAPSSFPYLFSRLEPQIGDASVLARFSVLFVRFDSLAFGFSDAVQNKKHFD